MDADDVTRTRTLMSNYGVFTAAAAMPARFVMASAAIADAPMLASAAFWTVTTFATVVFGVPSVLKLGLPTDLPVMNTVTRDTANPLNADSRHSLCIAKSPLLRHPPAIRKPP